MQQRQDSQSPIRSCDGRRRGAGPANFRIPTPHIASGRAHTQVRPYNNYLYSLSIKPL
jgi:hypothetical protein